jgi:DNA repair protein RadA/Sms
MDSTPVSLTKVESSTIPRTSTKIQHLDTLLGGGLVLGSSILLIGPPGAGKSTLVLQLLKKVNLPSLYVTGEESVLQLKQRADRLSINSHKIFLLSESNVKKIIANAVKNQTKMLVVDSIQTMFDAASDSLPGSPTQIRKCTYLLRRIALELNLVLIIVGQVTKDKTVAGPKAIEHAVDVVLNLDLPEAKPTCRILSATKNRYGSTIPKCFLRMRKNGIIFHHLE